MRGSAKVIKTTLGDLIAAVTDEVMPILRDPAGAYMVVSWVVNDVLNSPASARSQAVTTQIPKLIALNKARCLARRFRCQSRPPPGRRAGRWIGYRMQSDMKLVSVSVGLPRRQMMSHGDPVSAHERAQQRIAASRH